MRFHIPQFIEMEAKIVGPLTWKQFLVIGGAAAVLFILWFFISKFFWIIIAVILGGAAVALALIRVGGQPLPAVLKNFLFFTVSSKLYLWKKRKASAKVFFKKEKIKPLPKEEEKERAPSLKIVKKGRLGKLSTQIELHTK